MDRRLIHSFGLLVWSALVALLFWGAASPVAAPTPPGKQVITLRDFTTEEVKAVGLALARDVTIHVSAIGGGDKSFWRDLFDDNTRSSPMFAAGWIIDADTREPVWVMSMDNTSGKYDHRVCEEDVALKKGSYEVYFAAHSYVRRDGMSYSATNIDRREPARRHHENMVIRFFGDGDDRDLWDEFMEKAKNVWGISVTVNDGDATTVRTFSAPKRPDKPVIAFTGVGDNAYMKSGLSVSKDVSFHVYALGEGRKGDDVFDYGWIINTDTRERIWTMDFYNTRYAGGAEKNRKYVGDIKLPKGNYDICYATDGNHSREDWNAMPPNDPFNYGITLTLNDESDRNAVKVSDSKEVDQNVVVALTRVGNDEFKSAGFSLKSDTRLHIYAIGESNGDREMADYGWITNATTHDKVWTMERRHTYHAGGDSKNRLADEVITLPKGDYLVYYQTDGSHAYDEWNADPPFDKTHWGITITGVGNAFRTKNVSLFDEGKEEGVIAQLIRVRDDRHVRQRFTIDKRTTVRVYAIGEADDDEMADYGWIEDVGSGATVWEMTYRMTTGAGGAHKNRMVNRTIALEPGTYELHFTTDGSHAFNDWNDDPPTDRTHWGITVYRAE